ncbi:MAG: Plug domain-containing protein [Candidatus Competibacteraceae bacterium]
MEALARAWRGSGRIDSSRWAVFIRGFNGRFASKLLVMIDGRSVYNSQFSGVVELQDLFLPDVERIEVIRGAGGSLWGANAVNGARQYHHQE